MEGRIEKCIQNYRLWFEQFSWSWFGTLKITRGVPSKRRAKTLFDTWIHSLQNEEGGDDFRWVCVLESGRSGTNHHFHVLIGGLRNRQRSWENRWHELGGDARIRRFDHNQNGILYMLKTTDSSGDLDLDFCLPSTEPVSDEVAQGQEVGAETAVMLRVEGVDEKTSLDDLRRLAEKSAHILEITLHSVGGIVYGLLAVARTEAHLALGALNHKRWQGKKLTVSFLQTR